MSFPPIRNWVPALLAFILIFPLFGLPQPTNVSSIPWKVELLFSFFLIVFITIGSRSLDIAAGIRQLIQGRELVLVFLALALLCVWSAVSCFWAISPSSAIHHTLVWSNYLVLLGITLVIADRGGKSPIISVLCLIAVFVGGLAIFDFLTIQDFAVQEGTLRIRYAKFAEMLLLIAPLLFSIATGMRFGSRFVTLLLFGSAAWTGVMLSLSKGAFLAGSIGFVFLFVTLAIFKRSSIRKVFAAAAVWTVLTALFQFGIAGMTSIPTTVDYISGKHDSGGSTSDMRVFTWKVAGEMIASNLLFGVGGDNFGIAFNGAREEFAKAHPVDPDSAIGEDYIFERAHNEPLQIFAELGIVGIAIFGLLVIAIVFLQVRTLYRRTNHLSPLFFGGLAGMAAFAASSLVSSFSFRAYQNGIVFFMVLGLTLAAARRNAVRPKLSFDILPTKTAILLIPAFLIVFSLTKCVSQYVVLAGERSQDVDRAINYFDLAAKLDPDNAGAELAAAERFARENRWNSAVPHFRSSIDRGFGVSVIYSYMANAQEMSGDLLGAETTLRDAASMFPRSCFIRARLAFVLEKLGKPGEAAEQLSVGRTFNLRQTNGWYSVIKDGILNAHLNSQREPVNFAPPPELLPYNAIYAYNTDKVQVD